mgnify:CR=1 FL=1
MLEKLPYSDSSTVFGCDMSVTSCSEAKANSPRPRLNIPVGAYCSSPQELLYTLQMPVSSIE